MIAMTIRCKPNTMLATLEEMETRVRGGPDPAVLPYIPRNRLRQFPSNPSYFWLMHWRSYINDQMDKAEAMWPDSERMVERER